MTLSGAERVTLRFFRRICQFRAAKLKVKEGQIPLETDFLTENMEQTNSQSKISLQDKRKKRKWK